MNATDRNTIRSNLVFVIENTANIDQVVDHLIANGVATMSVKEELLNPLKTTYQKVSNVYAYIQRRGPRAFSTLLDALDATGNGFVADKLRGGRDDTTPLLLHQKSKKEEFFKDLCQSVSLLKPAAKMHDRSTKPIYKIGVDIFQGSLPKSAIGLNELPYFMALQGKIPRSEGVQVRLLLPMHGGITPTKSPLYIGY